MYKRFFYLPFVPPVSSSRALMVPNGGFVRSDNEKARAMAQLCLCVLSCTALRVLHCNRLSRCLWLFVVQGRNGGRRILLNPSFQDKTSRHKLVVSLSNGKLPTVPTAREFTSGVRVSPIFAPGEGQAAP